MRLKLKSLRSISYVLTATALFSCSNEDLLNEEIEETSLEDVSLTGKKIGSPSTSKNCRANNFAAQFYAFTSSTDVNKLNPKNKTIKEIDDRTCYYNYIQQSSGGRTVGVYRLKANSNHIDNNQPRIERATRQADNSKDGNGILFEGYVKIDEVGFAGDQDANRTSFGDNNGTYFIQAKGKHVNKLPNEVGDPAILLLIAKPIFSNNKVTSFEILSEEITKRAGAGSGGRVLKKITTVTKGQRFKVTMKNYFKKRFDQRVVVTVNGVKHELDVPNTTVTIRGERKNQNGYQAKIRFGAYRCKGGKAKISWDTVKQTKL